MKMVNFKGDLEKLTIKFFKFKNKTMNKIMN